MLKNKGKFFEKRKGRKWVQIQRYLSQAVMQQKAGQLLKAINSFYCAAKLFTRSILIELKLITATDWEKYNPTQLYILPQKRFLINHKTYVIYCPIPKVACSSLIKQLILENNPVVDIKKVNHTHNYAQYACSLGSYTYKEAMVFLQDERYVKCVFVRNPWSKLVSAYLNKVVVKSDLTCIGGLLAIFYKRKGIAIDHQKLVTFRQFIEQIVLCDERELDIHWQPQYLFLANQSFDFTGKFESLTTDFGRLKEKLKSPNVELIKVNSNQYDSQVTETEKPFYDYYPHELKQLAGFPDYRQFYSVELKQSVARYYQKDIELFGYTFDN